ncbi:hypothetical protein ES703_109405 [subsurface metagenome]
MHEKINLTKNNKELRRSMIKAVLLMLMFVIIMAIIFFTAAGRFDIPRAWLFFGAMLVYFLVSIIVLYKFNPQLIDARLKRRVGDKLWDKILMRVTNLFGVYVPIAIAGLDVGRFRWSYLSIYFTLVGFVLWIVSNFFSTWAMAVNKFFEPTVRIQKDREHQVIMTGPYRFVRHPGYLGGAMFYIAAPFIIGSAYALIPGAVAIVLITIRTALEDKTLQNELNGYTEYTKQVKYKLIPGIW